MTAPRLLGDSDLHGSETVANSTMNRERELRGSNGYARDLGFDPLDVLRERLRAGEHFAWLDLCCGTGRALIQAAAELQYGGWQERVRIVGVDLVGLFQWAPERLTCVQLKEASLNDWQAPERYDLITCVHGLHYIGDKLGLLCRAAGWLKPHGRFAANLDFANLRLEDEPGENEVRRWLRMNEFTYHSRRHVLSRDGQATIACPFRYLGADDQAGPNYTKQPAVDSYYARRSA